MFASKSTSGPLVALFGAGILFASVVGGQAAMAPAAPQAAPNIHKADCAVGMHIGPLGGCVLGTDDDRTKVIEHRSADDNDGGCTTKSINRTDNMGNSETKTKTNC